jgi:hypothetical protein
MATRPLRGIIFVPLDVRWPRTKKVRAMIVRHGLDGFAAWGLYLAMICYCRENLTDGFVPADEIGALAYPLSADVSEGLLKLLADYRLISPGHSPGHSGGYSPGHDDGHSDGYFAPAYVKRNGTRAETLDRAAELAERGRRGALSRWSEDADSPGHSGGHSRGQAETDRETKTDVARAPARGAGDGGWSPSGVLDRQAARRPVHKPSAQVLADARRPGGPTADATARADDARKALANRTRPLDAETDDTTDPTGTGLHGEQLARAQLAEIERRRAVERATAIGPAGTTDDDSESPDHGQPEDWPDDEPIVLPEHDDDEQADRTDDGDPLPDDVPF